MNISVKKIGILVRRDFKDFFKNPAVFITVLVPVFFVFLYKYLFGDKIVDINITSFVLQLGIAMNCSMCAIIIPSTSIAEEKEKFTLRTLMLSNISSIEFLTSKIILGFSITMVGNIIVYLISGSSMNGFGIFVIACILGSLSLNLLSAVLGLASRDQSSASVLQIPVLLLVMLPTMLGHFNDLLYKLGNLTPIQAMLELYYNGIDGDFFAKDVLINFVILLVWIVLSVVLFSWVYKKRGLDN